MQGAQATVDLEGIDLHRLLETLRQDHLENITGKDVLARLVDSRLERYPGAVRFHSLRDGALRQLTKGMENIFPGNRAAERTLELIQAALRILPGRIAFLP